jgi:RNA recognition motif-containing protein
MVHRNTGLSKGFGFVEFQRPDHAELAVAHMDGHKIGKKHLKVSFKLETGTHAL